MADGESAGSPRRHLLIAGPGRAGTSFLVRLLDRCGLETDLSRGAGDWFARARAGLETIPVKASDAPYVIKSPWSHEFLAGLLERREIELDGLIIPIRNLRDATASRIVLELQRLYDTYEQAATTGQAWQSFGGAPGGAVYSLEPLDQARVLAHGLYRLIETALDHSIPLAFLKFPRLVTDADYTYASLRRVIPNFIPRRTFREAFREVSDPAKVRIEDELAGEVVGLQLVAAEGEGDLPTLGDLDNVAAKRHLAELIVQLRAVAGEREEAAVRHLELASNVERLEAESAAGRKKEHKLRAERQTLERDLQSLRADLWSARTELESTQRHAESIRSDLSAQRGELHALQAERGQLAKVVESLSAERGELRRQTDVDRQRIGELEASVVNLRAALERRAMSHRVRGLFGFPRRAARGARLMAARTVVRLLPSAVLAHAWHNTLFDRVWYLDRYADVRLKGMHAERHFRRHGWREGRNPNAYFDTAWYLAHYPDVAESGMNPLDHYLLFGWQESRDPSPRFDNDWYLAANPDVAASGLNPLAHFLRHGAEEGRQLKPQLEASPASPHSDRQRLLLVVHDAHDHGAQQNALHLARTLNDRFHVALDIALLGEGALWSEFEECGRVHDLARERAAPQARQELFQQLYGEGVRSALCNTTVAGAVVPLLKECGYTVVTMVHELPGLIRAHGLEAAATAIAKHADAVVFASDYIRERFESVAGAVGERAHLRPQGLYRPPDTEVDRAAVRRAVRRELGLDESAQIVLGVGYADRRKGFDLFVEVFSRVRSSVPHAAFVWAGCEDPALIEQALGAARRLGFEGSIRLLPRVRDINRYYASADVHLLPSREDPYPSVVVEAMANALPTVAFAGATGLGELLERGSGRLAPSFDTDAMAEEVVKLLRDTGLRAALGAAGPPIIEAEFDWLDYVYFLTALAGLRYRPVSVVVPNYNYADYLEQRLRSILEQRYPIRDVTVLDDASTDSSLDTLDRLRHEHGWDFTVIASKENSGSVFRQWLRGVKNARGELLWIAEADDWAEPEFLARIVPSFDTPATVMAYSDSRQVDAAGNVLAETYLDYVRDIDPVKWTRGFARPGLDEVADSLAIRNTIPNVSAVLFDRRALLNVLDKHLDFIASFRVAGDYATYVLLLLGGRVAFVPEPLNNHRRHERGVTIGSFGEVVVSEIARVQQLVSEHVPLTREARQRAAQYLDDLRSQFSLPGPS